ncbi:hypothetical protein TrVE_jg4429 [Triparma verrucosa]|uniref:Uncharacterized protein n=1 Tax=Triparma verrucosa TaxID=1606542 RepID=A0A9W7B8B0_9STRA|nr:hypothetical protein TrVE_jg4429 [Triparma verrucosa]
MKRESSSIVDSAAVVPYSSLKTRKKHDSDSALFDILASHDDQSNYSLPLSTLQARDKASITLAYNHLSSLSVPSSIDQIYYTNGWSLETSLSKLCARGYDKISLPLASLIIASSKEEPGHPSPCAGPRPCLLKAVNGVVSDLNFLRLLIREFPPALTVTWSGSTALDFARSRANEEVISLIEVCTEAYKARSWR